MTEPSATTKNNTTSVNGSPSKPQSTPIQLEEALKSVEWIMDCAQADFFLMDELARFVWDHDADVWLNAGTVDTISIGVKRNWLTQYTSSTVQSMAPNFGSMPNEWQWEHDGVPVRVTIVDRKYKYLENLDQKPHLSGWFKLPNPFEKYWSSRFLIK